MSNSKTLVLVIVACDQEKHLLSVLDRFPSDLINHPFIEVLVVDDGVSGAGATIGKKWAEARGAGNFTVLKKPAEQGHGASQKLGYRIAVEAGFDFVVLLPGNGQYAPELLGSLINAWQATRAHVVVCSRTDAGSNRDRVPWHQLLGNRALTVFQNWITGSKLAGYPTGCRGYSTDFLRNVPFELNTNDSHFDTAILLQALHVGARIEQFVIPAECQAQISRIHGLRHARNILLTTLRYKMHQFGMLCDLRYRRLDPLRYGEKAHMACSSHSIALKLVQQTKPRKLLDIGCGPGFVAQACRKLGAEVTGIDILEPLPNSVDYFRSTNLNSDMVFESAFRYDMILLLDVIEHLSEPERFLLELRNRSVCDLPGQRPPILVLSTPNIAFIAIRVNLLLGRFNYAERGILDITHKRLFTRKSLMRSLEECGYEIERVFPAAPPFQAVMRNRTGRVLTIVAAALARVWPCMFAFQFVVVCRPRPGVMELLKSSHLCGRVSPGIGRLLRRMDNASQPASSSL